MKRYIVPDSRFVLLNNKGRRVRLNHRLEIPMRIEIYNTKDGVVDFRYTGSYEGEDDWYIGYAKTKDLKYVIALGELPYEDQSFINHVARCEGITGPYLDFKLFSDANHPRVYSIFSYLKKIKMPLDSKIHFAMRGFI